MIAADFKPDLEGWRQAARQFLEMGIEPSQILWSKEAGTLSLFDSPPVRRPQEQTSQGRFQVPAEFLEWARLIASAADPDRWDLLYRLLFRLKYERKDLLQFSVDPDVVRAEQLMKTLRRDIHKLHAFVRFKKTGVDGREHYVAWHKPEHPILELGAPFFARRFGDRTWSLFTPDQSAHWDLSTLTYGPGLPQHEFQTEDAFDEVWQTYYASIFNPARVKIKAMKAEMSPQYWSSMPETRLIPELIRSAPARLQEMAKNQNRQAEPPQGATLAQLRAAARSCEACPIKHRAQNLVFGEGPETARLMIVGEQPGDREDQEGRPFVGPAGEVLDECLRAAGLERAEIYVTSAVKHFKWRESETGSKIRIHQKASGSEMHACKPWLEAEIARVKPDLIVALGATAGTALLGRLPKVKEERGRLFESALAPAILLSWHPAAILRSFSEEDRLERLENLKMDLSHAKNFLSQNGKFKTSDSCFSQN